MKKTLTLLATCALTITLYGCASEPVGMMKKSMDTGAATAAISAAKAARSKAASVGGEWRDTGKMIKKAEKLAKEGKGDEAVKLAKAAELQGNAGYEQAMGQKAAAPRF